MSYETLSKIAENMKERFPVGTRVRLVQMNDAQAPKIGTEGTVQGVDGLASLLVHWDNGSTLNVLYGEDRVEKV